MSLIIRSSHLMVKQRVNKLAKLKWNFLFASRQKKITAIILALLSAHLCVLQGSFVYWFESCTFYTLMVIITCPASARIAWHILLQAELQTGYQVLAHIRLIAKHSWIAPLQLRVWKARTAHHHTSIICNWSTAIRPCAGTGLQIASSFLQCPKIIHFEFLNMAILEVLYRGLQ